MSRRDPVITGCGLICAAGRDVPTTWQSLRENKSGLSPLTLFASPRFGHQLVGQVREDVDTLAGNVRGSRSGKLCWIAAREALADAGLENNFAQKKCPARRRPAWQHRRRDVRHGKIPNRPAPRK